ncbi:succinate dehydrogenase [Rhodococcus rhodnii]|nr:succinate dehydrogenase cytochrome b subunit [Rhodococcus rhodnii]TXG90853.1 succinate dehydrogenase [Rhodococcus rhodnii]
MVSAPTRDSGSAAAPRPPRADRIAPRTHRRRPSDITLKTTMALTGIAFAGFVFVHMIGNLKVYFGQDEFDHYAHWLRTLLQPLVPYSGVLWILRIVLLASLIAHVVAAFLLTRRARAARGPHRRAGLGVRTLPARTMLVTGIVLLAFVVFHILDLTTGTSPVASSEFVDTTRETSHAYGNLVASFERWPVAVFYIVVMLLLGMHLVHGIWSVVHDLGGTGRRLRQCGAVIAGVVAVAVTVGNVSIPIAVLTGVVS